MKTHRKWIGTVFPLVAIFFLLYLPAWNCCAQGGFSPRSPFHIRGDLLLSSPIQENDRVPPPFPPMDIPDSGMFPPLSPQEGEPSGKERQSSDINSWSFFSLSLSPLENTGPMRDISGRAEEKNRLEMLEALTSGFSDMSSRRRLQSLGEIFEPEVKLEITF